MPIVIIFHPYFYQSAVTLQASGKERNKYNSSRRHEYCTEIFEGFQEWGSYISDCMRVSDINRVLLAIYLDAKYLHIF